MVIFLPKIPFDHPTVSYFAGQPSRPRVLHNNSCATFGRDTIHLEHNQSLAIEAEEFIPNAMVSKSSMATSPSVVPNPWFVFDVTFHRVTLHLWTRV